MAIPKKVGFYSIRKHARLMCKYIFIFAPIIRKAYPENTVLHALLDAAMAACEELIAEVDVVAPEGV